MIPSVILVTESFVFVLSVKLLKSDKGYSIFSKIFFFLFSLIYVSLLQVNRFFMIFYMQNYSQKYNSVTVLTIFCQKYFYMPPLSEGVLIIFL